MTTDPKSEPASRSPASLWPEGRSFLPLLCKPETTRAVLSSLNGFSSVLPEKTRMREGLALYGSLGRGTLTCGQPNGQHGLPPGSICMAESRPPASAQRKGFLKTIRIVLVGREVTTVTSGDAARLF